MQIDYRQGERQTNIACFKKHHRKGGDRQTDRLTENRFRQGRGQTDRLTLPVFKKVLQTGGADIDSENHTFCHANFFENTP